MPLNSITNQTIAMAGIVQSCSLVHQLATTGAAENAAMEASIASILKIDADSVTDVYGGLAGLRLGLDRLNQHLAGNLVNRPEEVRYAAQLVFLQNQLSKRQDMLNAIRTGILKAQTQSEQFGVLHPNVLANLADLYHSHISTLQPRIMVIGDQHYLSAQTTVNKIRACLLAGIRSAILWRQCGGSRWKLLLFRKKLQNEAQALLKRV